MLAEKYGPDRVHGIFMNNWSSTAKCAEEEWGDVQRVCDHIGIERSRVNFEKEYWIEVFEPMIDMYRRGLTPNPDVACNREIKFGTLLAHLDARAKATDAGTSRWWLATGHYARVARDTGSGTVQLMRPSYLPKDQSYYLATIPRTALDRIFFPLEGMTKPAVRERAAAYGLPTADKRDSQGLCFVGQSHRSFRKFLLDYIEPTPGNIVTGDGAVVGRHDGLWHLTIGQRAPVSMPQADPATRGTWFVAAKDFSRNELIIVRGADNPALLAAGVSCSSFQWLGEPPAGPVDTRNLFAQYRSLQEPEPVAAVEINPTGPLRVQFAQPRKAVAPGQYLALYRGDQVLGSGVIDATYPVISPASSPQRHAAASS